MRAGTRRGGGLRNPRSLRRCCRCRPWLTLDIPQASLPVAHLPDPSACGLLEQPRAHSSHGEVSEAALPESLTGDSPTPGCPNGHAEQDR